MNEHNAWLHTQNKPTVKETIEAFTRNLYKVSDTDLVRIERNMRRQVKQELET